MLRNPLSSRAILAGLVFFVVVVSGSLLYSWHVRRTTEAEFQRGDRFLQGREKQNKTRPTQTIDVPTDTETPGFVSTPDENTDTPMSNETNVTIDDTALRGMADAFLPDDFVSEEAEDAPVSAYGFGLYPELPSGFPENYWDGISREHELIARVWMRLMEQGIDVVGGTMQNGLVYPSISGTIYVEWDDVGTERYIARITGDPNTTRRIRDLQDPAAHLLPRLAEKDIPAGITVLTYPDGGIDPYQFLDLKKE